MDKKVHLQGIQAALTSALLLGFLPIFGKQALQSGFTPFLVVAVRSGIAALLLFVFMLFKRRFFYIYPVGLIGCVLAGFVNGIGSIFYYMALDRIGASVGHLLYSFYPLFVALWLLLDRQPISRLTMFRLVLAFPGAYLLLSTGKEPLDLLGAGFMLISGIFYALHLIINQRVLFEVPAPTVTFYTLVSMGVTVILAYLLFDRSAPPGGAPWWPLLGMAAITFLSRLTLFMGVKRLGGLQTALLGLGELFVTVVLAQIWLKESLTVFQWVGAGFVAVSLILVGMDRYTPAKRHQTGLLAWLNPPSIASSELPWEKN